MKVIAALVVLSVWSGLALADEGPAQEAGQKVDAAAATTKKEFTDSWITGKVKEQFLVDSLVKGRKITVTTKNHVVTLKGKVQSTEAQERALSIARNTDGVDDVVDHLKVKPVQG